MKENTGPDGGGKQDDTSLGDNCRACLTVVRESIGWVL